MKMADLAEVVRELGYDDVKTVLASGNVLFTTPDAAAASKDKLEAALRKRFGYEAWVHVLTVDAVQKIIDAYPFERAAPTGTRTSIFILKPEVRDELLALELDPTFEQAQAGDGVVYWTVPKGSTLDSAMGKAQGSSKHKPWVDDPQPQHAREADALVGGCSLVEQRVGVRAHRALVRAAGVGASACSARERPRSRGRGSRERERSMPPRRRAYGCSGSPSNSARSSASGSSARPRLRSVRASWMRALARARRRAARGEGLAVERLGLRRDARRVARRRARRARGPGRAASAASASIAAITP